MTEQQDEPDEVQEEWKENPYEDFEGEQDDADESE